MELRFSEAYWDENCLIYHFFREKEKNYASYAGLILVGFGEQEIYPQLHSCQYIDGCG